MKKVYSLLALGALTLSASAKVDYPAYLMEDFKNAFSAGVMPEGWSTLGVDAKPTGELANYFPDYSVSNAFSLLGVDADVIAFSPSTFAGGVASDQWLITPAFTVTEADNMLTYVASAYGNRVTNNFKVMISEGGTAKEDFTELASSGIKGAGTQVNMANRRTVLDSYKGKTVRLAFVNADNTSGMTGFGSIYCGPYYIRILEEAKYNTYVLTGDNEQFSMTVGLVTPVKCTGFTAKLTTSTGFESEYVSTTKFTSSKEKQETFKMPGNIDFGGLESADYTLTITPNYEGAPSTVVSGQIIKADLNFNKVAIMEELTGTWCGYCTYGYALMNYLTDKYNGEDGNPLAIGVAVHNGDPMAIADIDSSITNVGRPLGFNGYPCMLINREVAIHPSNSLDYVADLVSQKTFAGVDLKSVNYYETEGGKGKFNVKYDLTLGYGTDNSGLKALVITTMDGLSGKTSAWSQSNYISSTSASQIAASFGEDVVPYFEPFLGTGDKVRGLPFDDVAYDYYPSVEGQAIEGSFVKNEASEKAINFEFDLKKNTEKGSALAFDPEKAVVIVAILGGDGKVVTADKMEYKDFTLAVNGVEAASNIAIRANAGKVAVNAPADGVAYIYSTDGRLVAKANLSEGMNLIDAPRGLAIVKVQVAGEAKTAKVMVK